MDLEAVYFVSQVVAAFAIVGSLVFVGMQTRAATRQARRNEAVRRNAAADAVHRDFGKYYALVSDPQIAPVMLKGLSDVSSLSEPENVIFMSANMVLMANVQSAYLKWDADELSDDLWHSWRMAAISVFVTPGGRAFWQRRKHLFAKKFVACVESELLDQKLPEGAWSWDQRKQIETLKDGPAIEVERKQ